MTSGRGQNVSILQPPSTETWEAPITAFSDSGGSLRSAPRNNSLKSSWVNGKNSGQHSSGNRYDGKDYAAGNKCPNALITNSASSSSILNSVNRELSPVRWCDREVDGVYLGKSGWVQVQQRSLDDPKAYGENYGSSTLPSRKDYLDFEYNSRAREKRERSRPVNLPLPTKKCFDNHEGPSKFIQEFDSVSPPSVTPIISPPPAFKDDKRDAAFPKKTFFCRESETELLNVKNVLEERRNILNSSSSTLLSTLKHNRPSYRALHTKSLEDRYSKSLLHNKRFDSSFAMFGFRSLDNDSRAAAMVNSFEEPDKPVEYSRQKRDGLNGRNTKTLQQRNYQRNPRIKEFGKAYRTRTPSLDSSSSDSSAKSSRIKQSQAFEYENSIGRGNKHGHVKRSRSLQLCEKKSPTELLLLNHSEKSWDPVPPEYLAFQIKNQNGERHPQFPQHLDHVLVTVNGESVPVVTNQYLSKITTCEEEQRKLVLEAEKEARIISEFLSGTRSRAAARNLLMHRYLNRPEDSVDTFQYDAYSLDRKPQNKPIAWRDARGSLRKRGQPNPPNSNPRQQSKPFASFWRPSSRTGSVSSLSYAEQRKKEQKEAPVMTVTVNDRRSKRKSPFVSRSSDPNYSNSGVEKTVFGSQTQKQRKLKKHGVDGVKPGNYPKDVVEGENTFDDSSSVSSSSSDGCSRKVFYVSDSFDDRGLNGNSAILHELFHCRSGSAPESDDCISTGINQRSLSLPRSFLSERHRLNQANQRDLFPWQQEPLEIPDEISNELLLTQSAEGSRTAPTTPVRDVRSTGESTVGLSQIHCMRSSCGSLLDQHSYLNSQRMSQKVALEQSAMKLNENNPYRIDNVPLKITDNSTESGEQKLKKKFSLNYPKTKANKSGQETEEDSKTSEILSLACRLINDLQAYDDQVPERSLSFRFLKDRSMGRKGIRNEKYDSHDSGIQMGNRGNLDSSESQDTDLQEDFDSPLAVRRRDVRAGYNYCRPQSEVFNQVLIDKFKADLQWQTRIKKRSHGKGVRRTNSDLGGQRLFNWDAKNHSRKFPTHSSPMRGLYGRNIWQTLTSEDSCNRFASPQLRRSLSQPLGLNELPPFVRRRSSTLKCFALSEDEKNPRGRNSEDEFLSDSESSVASLIDRKKSFDFVPKEEAAILAEAVWDHVAMESCELPFRAGEVIEVLDTRDRDWWWGATSENCGYFPSAFVRLRVSQEDTVEDCLAAMAKGKHASTQLRRGKSVSLLSNDQVRSSVVRELLNTERDFVKVLRDVKDGYLIPCRRRTDMFAPAQITTIFSNLEDLLMFQENFLKDLEARVDREFPYKSCIGQVFLSHGSGFRMYSEYCNSHPMAIAMLQDLYQKANYCKFFETCRLKQSLSEIPLDGYLLTPVQRICKYPLQLAELLKYTKPDHPDHRIVQEALETMRRVATLINERKRKMESLEKLAAWQQRVEGWEGEDLIEISSQLIHQGDVVRITSGMWTSNITLFLFDHQIIYCKKDLLKRNIYIYKGRILLDASTVLDLPDGKNQQLGVTVKYGLKITNSLRDKWLLFCCRSGEDKAKWLEALAEEKRIVAQDKEGGLDLPPTAKELAKMAARTKKCPPCKPRGKNKMAPGMPFENGHSKSKSSRRMGNWFTFGGVMKNSKVNLRPRVSPQRIT